MATVSNAFARSRSSSGGRGSSTGCLVALLGCLGLGLLLVGGLVVAAIFLLPRWMDRIKGEFAVAPGTSAPPTKIATPRATERKPAPPATERRPPPDEPEWVDAARDSARQGDVRVSVTEAVVGLVRGKDAAGEFVSDDKHLSIRVRLDNLGAARSFEYDGWAVGEVLSRDEAARLTDDRGNSYRRVNFGAGTQVKGQVRWVSVAPGKSVEDVLVFEVHPAEAEFLKLDLPARNFGGSGRIGFRIPRSMIRPDTTPAQPPVVEEKVKTIGELAKALKDSDRQTRLDAARELASRGAAAGGAVTELAEALAADKDPTVRAAIATALGKIGPAAHPAFLPLLRALGDPDEPVRRAARDALARIGPPAPDDLPDLQQALKSPSTPVRLYALQALGRLGLGAKTAAPVYAPLLKDSDRDVRLEAARALGKFGPDGRGAVLPVLIEALRDPDDGVRQAATDGLKRLGPSTEADLPVLRAALKDSSADVRLFAGRALATLGPKGKDAIPELSEALRHAEAETRRVAAEALGNLGPGAKDAVKPLQRALGDADAGVRLRAVEALGKLGPAARPALDDISCGLSDADPAVRKATKEVLSKLDASALVQAYARVLLEKNAEVRKESAEALGALGPDAKPAFPHLVLALGDDDPTVRVKVARAMAKVNPETTAPLRALTELLKDPKEEVRREAAETLVLLAPVAIDAVPALAEALKDTDLGVRQHAAAALGKLGRRARMTAPALIAAMSDRRMHEAAGDALVKIGPDTVPALAEAITNPDVSVRLGVVRTLGKFGPDAKDALKPLNTAFYMEKDDDVTKAIRETMARIEGKP